MRCRGVKWTRNALIVATALFVSGMAFSQPNSPIWGTLGQLCKKSQSVLVGDISSVQSNSEWQTDIYLTRCSNLLGVAVGAVNSITVDSSYRDMEVSNGQHVLIFICPTRFDPLNDPLRDKAYEWGYVEKYTNTVLPERLYATGSRRGVIVLDADSGATLIDTIRQYWSHLRANDRDPVRYADFLVGAQTSIVERVRRDARRDMMTLIGFADKPRLQALKQMPSLSEEQRKYVEKIIDWNAKGKPRKVRDLTPKEEDLIKWRSALREGPDDVRSQVLIEMTMSPTPSWIASKSDVWREDVANMLTNSSYAIRGFSALLLDSVKDKRAIPVMIELLGNADDSWRRMAWDRLKVKCGDSVSFDPDASPTMRAQSIKAVEDWYKKQLGPAGTDPQ